MKRTHAIWGSMGIAMLAWAAVFSLRLNPVMDLTSLQARQPASSAEAVVTPSGGAALYAAYCGSCHGAAGEGRYPVFPPLVASPHVVGDAASLIDLVLQGRSGPMEVNGVAYDGYMPPFDGELSDQDLATLASYLRSSWGNRASAVTADDVAMYRASRTVQAAPAGSGGQD